MIDSKRTKEGICYHCRDVCQVYEVGVYELCERHKGLHQYQTKQPKTKINKVSKKRQPLNTIYNRKAKLQLQAFMMCETECGKIATQVHHKQGREGYADEHARLNDIPLIIDERFFMSVCPGCHTWIEKNPEDAKKKGYSLNRIKIN